MAPSLAGDIGKLDREVSFMILCLWPSLDHPAGDLWHVLAENFVTPGFPPPCLDVWTFWKNGLSLAPISDKLCLCL